MRNIEGGEKTKKSILLFKTTILLNFKLLLHSMAGNKVSKKTHNPCEDDVYSDEEQGIRKKETKEEVYKEMDSGGLPEDPDVEEGREALVDEDAMEPWEAGFAEGASDEGQHAKDALTGEPLMDVEEVVETEIDGKTYRFVSEKNAEKFRQKQLNEKRKKK